MYVEDAKAIVRRFNLEVIQEGNAEAFARLMSPDFINHSTPANMPNGPDAMWHTFQNVLRPALSNLIVTIHDQIAEGDKVTTRKTISGIHTGTLFGLPATGKAVAIQVIDVVRIQDGKYAEHWGVNTLSDVLGSLSKG